MNRLVIIKSIFVNQLALIDFRYYIVSYALVSSSTILHPGLKVSTHFTFPTPDPQSIFYLFGEI